MPKPAETPRRPDEFASYLKTPEPVLLVGGQAVNLWALYFGDVTADLAPFVSADADVLGNRETLESLGRIAKTKPQFFPLRPPSNEVGVVTISGSDGNTLLVEVLRSVHGVTEAELRNPAYLFELGEYRTQVLVPGPIALLRAKVANAHDFDQTGRQDFRHVQILARILPKYLQQLVDTAASKSPGALTDRTVVDYAESLLKLLREPKSKKVFGELGISRTALFLKLVTPPSLPKFGQFLEIRLPKALPPE
ncbi:MAG: hypothetical protein ACN6I3_00390 [bacterium]